MTLRELNKAIVESLQTDAACAKHSAPAQNIMIGKTDGDMTFPTPSIVVYARPIKPESSESGRLYRKALVTVFCIVAPERDAVEAEANAMEMAEGVEAFLTSKQSGFDWDDTETFPELDGSYADYTASYISFTHNYTSSKL